MLKINLPNNYYTPRQLKLSLEIEKLIDVSDSVYTFCEVMNHIDLSGYFVANEYKTGRPWYDKQKLLKVILFAFMENGYCSLRNRESILSLSYQKRYEGVMPIFFPHTALDY